MNAFFEQPGVHCETSTLRMMLHHEGLNLSEAMIFGLGRGLDYVIWPSPDPRHMMPILSGRIDSGRITEHFADALSIKVVVQETESPEQAFHHLQKIMQCNKVAGLKLDIFYLDYFSSKRHFCAHYVAMHKYDAHHAYLVDTAQQGGAHKLSLDALALARNSTEGYQASRNLSMYVQSIPDSLPIETAARRAIYGCAENFLDDRRKNAGPQGLVDTGREMCRWLQVYENPEEMLLGIANFWEFAGTGGANFRRLYQSFLLECDELFGFRNLNRVIGEFERLIAEWGIVIDGLREVAKSGSQRVLDATSTCFLQVAERETHSMQALRALSKD